MKCHAAKRSFFHLSASESWIFLYALLHWHSFHLLSRLNCATSKHTACLVQSTKKHLLVSMQYIKHNHLIYTIENQTPKTHMQKLAGNTCQQMHLHSCTWTHITLFKNERHSETSSILTGRSTRCPLYSRIGSVRSMQSASSCQIAHSMDIQMKQHMQSVAQGQDVHNVKWLLFLLMCALLLQSCNWHLHLSVVIGPTFAFCKIPSLLLKVLCTCWSLDQALQNTWITADACSQNLLDHKVSHSGGLIQKTCVVKTTGITSMGNQ